jgi:hypothetical protein
VSEVGLDRGIQASTALTPAPGRPARLSLTAELPGDRVPEKPVQREMGRDRRRGTGRGKGRNTESQGQEGKQEEESSLGAPGTLPRSVPAQTLAVCGRGGGWAYQSGLRGSSWSYQL